MNSNKRELREGLFSRGGAEVAERDEGNLNRLCTRINGKCREGEWRVMAYTVRGIRHEAQALATPQSSP